MVVNLKTAKALGLTVPLSILLPASGFPSYRAIAAGDAALPRPAFPRSLHLVPLATLLPPLFPAISTGFSLLLLREKFFQLSTAQ